jgi:putative transposase
VEALRNEYPVRVLCETLGVSLSGYYAWKNRPMSQHQREDHQLAEHIHAVYHACRQVYGSPRIHAELRDQGIPCSRKRVARLMRERGLNCTSPTSSDYHDTQRAWSACYSQCVGSGVYRDSSE